MITLMNNMPITVFGASHEAFMGITIKNFPQGIKINYTKITEYLKRRTSFPYALSTRKEDDHFKVTSGVKDDITTGEDLTFIIENKDINPKPYEERKGIMRPSHADYVAWMKYKNPCLLGGGVFSGRMSALYMILGALFDELLNKQGIKVYARLKSLKDINDDASNIDYTKLDILFPVASSEAKSKMLSLLQNLHDDSVGGVIEICIKGLPAGLGEPIFGSLEASISQAMFAIPGIKGIEFGGGFAMTTKFGSEVNDQMKYQGNKLVFLTNYSGGIQGGLSNGEDLVFCFAVKQTQSIAKPQRTVDVINKTNVMLQIQGRHDKAFIMKAIHVASSMTSYAIYQILRGNDYE